MDLVVELGALVVYFNKKSENRNLSEQGQILRSYTFV